MAGSGSSGGAVLSVVSGCICVLVAIAVRSAARAWRRTLVGRSSALGDGAPSPGAVDVGPLMASLAGTAPARAIRRRLAARTYDLDLAEALDGVARQLRAGAVLSAAVAAVAVNASGAVGRDLRTVAARTKVVGLEAALDSWVIGRRAPAADLAAVVLSVGFSTGGATAHAVDQAAVALRQRAAALAEAHSMTAQARLSAAVLSIAPLVFAAVVSAIDPAVGTFLVATPTGAFLVAAGLALDAAGWWWMRRLVAAVAW